MADGPETMRETRKTAKVAEVLQKLEEVMGSIRTQIFDSGARVGSKKRRKAGETGSLPALLPMTPLLCFFPFSLVHLVFVG